MHSFALLALASSALALPLVNSPAPVNSVARRGGSVLDVPVTALTSVEKVAKVDYTNVGPVDVNAANIDLSNSNIADNVGNNLNVLKRRFSIVKVPVTAVTGVDKVAKVDYTNVGPVDVNAANVDLSNSNIADNVGNNIDVAKRDFSVVKVPVTALTSAKDVAKVEYTNVGPVTANAANVDASYSNILDNDLNNVNVLKRDFSVVKVPVAALTSVENVANVDDTNVGPIDVNAANVDASYSNILDNDLNNVNVLKRGGSVVDVPVTAITSAEKVAKVDYTNVGPVDVNAANVDASYSNILDNDLNNVDVAKRATLSVPAILTSVESDLSAIVHDVDFILGSNPTPAQIDAQFLRVSGLFASTTREIQALQGSNSDLLLGPNGVDVTLATVAATINNLLITVAGLVQDVKAITGIDLTGVDSALTSDIQGLLNAVNTLLPPINSLLNDVLALVAGVLASLGITIQL